MSFDPDEDEGARPRKSRAVWVLVAALLVACGVGAVWLWKRYDPFVMDRPDMREASGLLGAARHRPLTDEEFDRAVALLGAETPAAQLPAIATIEADVGRAPARRDRAIAALEGCPPDAAPATRSAAATAANRLKAAPKPP